ncbi:hypothetical protein T458_11160 [Brevibacillus panacihumi W25]|uniref:DUF5316 domain-containing protein n=1 Tax=Brevibacillus panacihumi W25 TaxID=1408254 RepID=V6MB78_9BACL|nr:DUF5316 domain-containing protein [Brevibacillus panacihumi]EST55115.1 hypothetical protein T458_11160 [Brevibacillus panacihumi W25]
MKGSLIIGLGLLIISTIWSLIANDLSLIVKLSGSFGVICLLLSAIFVGAMNDGDRIRSYDNLETKDDRRTRRKWAINLAIVGLPNLITAILILIFKFAK